MVGKLESVVGKLESFKGWRTTMSRIYCVLFTAPFKTLVRGRWLSVVVGVKEDGMELYYWNSLPLKLL